MCFGLAKVVLAEDKGFAGFAALPDEGDSATNGIPNHVIAPESVPAFRILPEDVVQDSIQQVRFATNQFAVRWTFTEAGANKMLAFEEAHEGQKTCTVIGSYKTPPGVISHFLPMPAFTNYTQWKEGWLKHRTDKMFSVTEADAQAITAGLQRERQDATNRPAWLSFTNDAVQSRENITGILTDPNFRVVIHALEQRSGSETLAEPEVITSSGRGRNQMRRENIVIVATSAVTNPPTPSTKYFSK